MIVCFCVNEYNGNKKVCPQCDAPNPDKGTPKKTSAPISKIDEILTESSEVQVREKLPLVQGQEDSALV